MESADIWLLLDSSRGGGIESHVRALAAELRAKRLSALVVFLEDHGPHPLHAQLDRDGIPWMSLKGGLIRLIVALKSARPRILHTHGYKAGILGRVAARFLGQVSVHTFHSGEPGQGRVRLWQTVDRITARINDQRIAVSQEIAQRVSAQTEVLPNFIAMPQYVERPALKRSVAYVGRLSPEKGPDIFCRVAETFHNVLDFHVYGEGPMQTELMRAYGDTVRFHGYVDNMDEVWKNSDALLITSRHEGLPLVALEAMACGTPVIAARVGALPDVVHDNVSGWLFASGDVEDASAAVRKWLGTSPGTLDTLRAAARHTVKTAFSSDAVVKEIIAVYRMAIDHRVGRPVTRRVSGSAPL